MQKESTWILRKARRDRLDDTPVTAAPDREVKGCVVWPRSAFETERGWVGIDGWNIKMPAGTDIASTDQVRVREKVYNVDGTPADYGRKGIIVNTKRVA